MSDLNNLYTLARRGLQAKNYEQSVRYYEQIMLEDPYSWEATFYYYIGYAILCGVNGDLGKAIQLTGGAIDTIYDLLENEQDLEEQKNNISATNEELGSLLSTLRREIAGEYLRDSKGVDASSEYYKSINNTRKARERVMKEIQRHFEQRKQRILEIAAKQRFVEFWANNQPLKETLENEKKALGDEISNREYEIKGIPAKDVEHARLMELHKLLESQNADKKSLGFFAFMTKSAENKEAKQKMKATQSQIAPIQARIDSAIQAVQRQIDTMKKRIAEIDHEFTKHR
jgi:tetratricopeptide (TPR) repeat protein